MILFLGDSITDGTDWSRFIDFADILNLAVPGHTTDDLDNLLANTDSLHPKVISILIGTNDFGNPELDRPAELVGAKVIAIAEKILLKWPDAEIIVNGLLPRGLEFSERIHAANSIIAKFQGEKVHHLNSWSMLSDGNHLRDEYLLDDGFDVHLNPQGYESWAEVLVPKIKELYLG